MNCHSKQYKVTLYSVYIFATLTLMAKTMAEDECLPCVHGICGGGKCRCHEGYSGVLCEECVPSDHCVNGYCINPGGCKCKPGWDGMFCDVDSRGYCNYNNPCSNGGTCYSLGRQGFTCICAEGFSGITCENWIHGPCSCKNGGVCVESRDGRGCLCPIHYDGEQCENFTGHCDLNGVCSDNSTCVHIGNGYRCDCKPNQCEPNLMQCTESTCKKGLECSKRPGQLGYTCQCPKGTAGHGCSMRPLCIMDTCENGGRCFETLNNVMCVCKDGYTGIRCETKLSTCEYNPCANNGTCVVGYAGLLCQCPVGYAGKYCDCKITSDNTCETEKLTNNCSSLTNFKNILNQRMLTLLLILHLFHCYRYVFW